MKFRISTLRQRQDTRKKIRTSEPSTRTNIDDYFIKPIEIKSTVAKFFNSDICSTHTNTTAQTDSTLPAFTKLFDRAHNMSQISQKGIKSKGKLQIGLSSYFGLDFNILVPKQTINTKSWMMSKDIMFKPKNVPFKHPLIKVQKPSQEEILRSKERHKKLNSQFASSSK